MKQQYWSWACSWRKYFIWVWRARTSFAGCQIWELMTVPMWLKRYRLYWQGKALWKTQRVQMLSKPSFVHGLVTEPLFLRPPIYFFFLLYFDCEPSGAGFGVCSSSLHACIGISAKGSWFWQNIKLLEGSSGNLIFFVLLECRIFPETLVKYGRTNTMSHLHFLEALCYSIGSSLKKSDYAKNTVDRKSDSPLWIFHVNINME